MSTLGEELVAAAEREDGLARVRQLLDLGVDVNSNFGNWTALTSASHYGRAETVDLLLERGATVNALSAGGLTALIWACYGSNLDVLKKLVAAGASINVGGQSSRGPLSTASLYGHLECCEYLLSLGANLMAIVGNENTPMCHFGSRVFPRLPPEAVEHARAVMTAAWRAGPHPSQVQRRRDEAWDRRKSIMQVSAENGYRPLLHRQLAEKAAIASLDPAAPIPAIEIDTPTKRHAHLLGQVLSNEGIHRNIVSML